MQQQPCSVFSELVHLWSAWALPHLCVRSWNSSVVKQLAHFQSVEDNQSSNLYFVTQSCPPLQGQKALLSPEPRAVLLELLYRDVTWAFHQPEWGLPNNSQPPSWQLEADCEWVPVYCWCLQRLQCWPRHLMQWSSGTSALLSTEKSS